ncbi:MAG: periplasmic heavy metal sensor [Maricaulis sp.]|uniref:periplasmic heavy metal sensor n=1 Tax=Maricaulis sp. TaxID=1486257 RepID=UPI00260D15DE|nr:periplasmic heavy metal sensor [Maricaulis sp.]MDM7983411.1 periplasmic heavy metal sensor [Maricaulis sp.]
MRSSTPWIIALLVSVLANGAMIGFVLQREVAPAPPTEREARLQLRGAGGPGRFDIRGFIDALPEAQRADLRERMEAEMGIMRGLMREARDARIEAAEILLEEPFDAAAVQAALERRRVTRAAIEAHIEQVIVEIAADLDPQTREQVLREARRGPPRGERRGPPRFDRRGPPPERRRDN